jgi:sugar/nucleoside kinase (ribokinase family)
MSPRIIVGGRITLDCYAFLDDFTSNIEVTDYYPLPTAGLFLGGSAANTAIWFSALGYDIELHISVDRDNAGRFLKNLLDRAEITLRCQHVEEATSISFVFLN